MQTTVIGYSWCPHYKHVVEQLTPNNTITFEDIDRKKIKQAVEQTIGARRPIGILHYTSPQIVCCWKNYAVCIDGESALNQIGDSLETYVKSMIPTFSQYLDTSAQTYHGRTRTC